jgi:magnesium transporter
MNEKTLEEVLSELRLALEKNDLAGAIRLIKAMRAADQGEVFEDLDADDQASLLPELDAGTSADILEYIEDEEAARLIGSLATEKLVAIVNEMEPDEVADLLGDIEPEQAREILAQLEHPEEVRPLLSYSDESAGGLMTSEYLALRQDMTVRDALEAVRRWGMDKRNVYYVYILNEQEQLSGVTDLQALIGANPDTSLAEIMEVNIVTVNAGADQEACAELMSHYDLIALPVVDEGNTLVGVITVDDVLDVLVEEATEDIQKLGGAAPLGVPYLLTKVTSIFRKRIGWLFLLFLTESLTGTVLRYFEEELQAVVALSFFVPLLIGTGGNAGTQTTSTIIRALAVGEMHLRDALRAVWHETRVGLLLGVVMAVVAYGRALTWGTSSGLALTVALSILSIVVWANLLGAILPTLAMRFKIDPTVVSGPVMSTLVDATGLFIYFTIAKTVLGL